MAVVFNPAEFVSRFRRAAQSVAAELDYGHVRYVDESQYSGDWGAFVKPSRLSYQREFRFILKPGTAAPRFLELGPLEDICHTGASFSVPGGDTLRLI